MSRPSFHDLTPDQQAQFGNGIGPVWMPNWMRGLITKTASWFFKDASWRHHDFGYSVGYSRMHRRLYDRKFYRAMLRDAVSQPALVWLIAAPVAILIATLFFIAVRLFGGFGSFHFGTGYRSLAEILSDYEESPNQTAYENVIDVRWTTEFWWLEIEHDGNITFDTMQRIKNDFFGHNVTCKEVYPASTDLINTGNYRHLFRSANIAEFC